MEVVENVEKTGIAKSSCEGTHQASNCRTGGLRTMPFIIANEVFEKISSLGLSPNMMFYFRDEYGFQIAAASSVLSLWSAASNALSIAGAVLADSYMGRFRVIILGSFCSFLGMALLWLTATIPQLKPSSCSSSGILCDSANLYQLAVLFTSLGFISIGAGCIKPCSMAFGADQLTNEKNSSNKGVLDTYFNWYYAASGISTVIGMTVIVYIQDEFGWGTGYVVPAVLMLLSALIFLAGSSLYVKVKPAQSLFTGIFQVIVVAFKNRRLSLPYSNFDQYYLGHDPKLLVPTDSMRCLNKACLIKDAENDLNPDGSVSNPWNLCSVDQVESLKNFIRIIPVWSTGIIMVVCINQNALGALQAKIMNRHITGSFEFPAGSINVFMIISLSLWLVFYDRIIMPLLKRCGHAGRLSPELRIGIGLLLSCFAMAIAAVVEATRRRIAIEEGLEDQPNAVVDMSALWLVPQCVVLGVAEGFNAVGQIEYFFSKISKVSSSMAVALHTVEMSVANLVGSILVQIVNGITGKGNETSWLDNNLNKGHLDYFYWLCAALALVNLCGYLLYNRAYGFSEKIQGNESSEIQDFEYRNLPSS
ncbi:protein NRT1/ PTR FAMILY 1.2-like [Momordica charantia]|uniref:Protein NRT1/ PTR FAMILY 1.2-like n=1 Tax=Momordica charantia TaxID=3673 RepID=A0A6J1BQY7_MOMCH|nr:protein NRT1/ PTR FAMILY 1.2-like [Momordica charantia]